MAALWKTYGNSQKFTNVFQAQKKDPEEKHIVNGKITPEYFKWREKGFNCQYAVRYPVGQKSRHE